MLKLTSCLLQTGLAAVLGAATASAGAQSVTATPDDQQLSVTIYNSISLINDQRSVSLFEGVGEVAMPRISPKIVHDSVRLQSEGSFEIRDQNYHYDLLTPANLLKKHVGDPVTVVRRLESGPDMEKRTAELLAVQNRQAVFRFEDGTIGTTGLGAPYFFEFQTVPETLYAEPTLTWTLDSDTTGETDWTISYLTNGLSWKTAYVMTLDEAQSEASMNGWVTITNDTGIAFDDASISVVAGSPNRASSSGAARQFMMDNVEMAAARAPQPKEQSLGQYKIYNLPYRYDVASASAKQINLLSAESIPVEVRNYTAIGRGHHRTTEDGYKVQGVRARLHFDNEEPHLGRALPKGIVRIMQPGPEGELRFMGEDNIGNTADKESVSLAMGKSFDLTTHFRRTSYSSEMNNTIRHYSYEGIVKNGGDKSATVRVKSPHLRGNWSITQSSADYEKLNSSTVEWEITVPAKSESRLTFSVREKH